MSIKNLILPSVALSLGFVLLSPGSSDGFSLIGFSLPLSQRDFRIHNNFNDPEANNNQAAHPNFPGAQGAVMAIWKGVIEWSSGLHGDGGGDPSQSGELGSGGANFDPSFQNLATAVGFINSNTHSEISGGSGGVLAFTEGPSTDGWRIRYYADWLWQDGPEESIGSGVDLQGVACHEYGHALGLDHSSDTEATMFATNIGTGVAARSIEADDIAGVQAIYGAKSNLKPTVTGYFLTRDVLTVKGINFDPTGNQVWFTQLSTGGNGQPVKVTGLASPSGTTLSLNLPANAGPGDILVRQNSTAHAALSNAFPFDPAVGAQTCGITPYGAASGGGSVAVLDSFSSPDLGSDMAIFTMDYPGAMPGLLAFGLAPSVTPLLGGISLLDLNGPLVTMPIATSSFGFSLTLVPIPNIPTWAYLPIYAQAICYDAGSASWLFTNGIEITICP